MSNSPHVSNNICVSLATIELGGTITYIKIWDIACEAEGAKGTSIVLQVRRFMFSFWMTTSKSLPPFLPPFSLFRPTVCRLLCSLSCTKRTPNLLPQPKPRRTCGKQSTPRQAMPEHHSKSQIYSKLPGMRQKYHVPVPPPTHKGTDPAWIPCVGVSNIHRSALNTAAAWGCGTRGYRDNILGPFWVRTWLLSRVPPSGNLCSRHSCETHA